MENDAQTGEDGHWHSRLKMYIPVDFFPFFVQMYLVHIWAGLVLGWFWNTDQSRKVWTWIKTLFVPDVNTNRSSCCFTIEGLVAMYRNLLASKL